jgi:hypothetical protein
VLPCLHLTWTPPALRGGTALRTLEVLLGGTGRDGAGLITQFEDRPPQLTALSESSETASQSGYSSGSAYAR